MPSDMLNSHLHNLQSRLEIANLEFPIIVKEAKSLSQSLPPRPIDDDGDDEEHTEVGSESGQVDKDIGVASSQTSTEGEPELHFSDIDPYLTERQDELRWFDEHMGIVGVAHFIHKIAQTEIEDDLLVWVGASSSKRKRPQRPSHIKVGGHESWNKVLRDFKRREHSRALFSLASLAPKLIKALLKGNIPSELQDKAFANEIQPQVTPQHLPGTYSCFVAVTSPQNNSQASASDAHNVGKGLTLRHWIEVANEMRTYIDVGRRNSAQHQSRAQAIDTVVGSWAPRTISYRTQRRYGGGGRENRDYFKGHEFWLNLIDVWLLRWARSLKGGELDHLLDMHLDRCLAYVGLSTNVRKRIPQHESHTGYESPVFGLFFAVVRYLFRNMYNIEYSSYQIIKTTQKEDIALDEIITSLLVSSFLWDGGLNYTFAGGSNGGNNKMDGDVYQDRIDHNVASIHKTGNLQRNIDLADKRIQECERLIGYDPVEEANELIRQRSESLDDRLKSVQDQITMCNALYQRSRLVRALERTKRVSR